MMTAQELKQLPTTILSQLGGNQFVMMTGVKNIQFSGTDLTMKLPKCETKATHLTIHYEYEADLYSMIFKKFSMKDGVKVLEKIDGVYFDMLRSIFEQETGLRTSLEQVFYVVN